MGRGMPAASAAVGREGKGRGGEGGREGRREGGRGPNQTGPLECIFFLDTKLCVIHVYYTKQRLQRGKRKTAGRKKKRTREEVKENEKGAEKGKRREMFPPLFPF
jgi:hypothetical protein